MGVLWFWCLWAVVAAHGASRPNILYILADDYGWADIGYHRTPPSKEVQTPHLDSLAAEGVKLDRYYVYKFCSPTRSAIQSGRNPIHVNAVNAPPQALNPADPVGGFAGIPRNMTGIAEHLQRAGYATHMAGKWDAGMATHEHTPQGRGYDTSLNYFSHANDYWTSIDGKCGHEEIVDLWHTDKPAFGMNNSFKCSQENQAPGCVYEDELFTQHLEHIITNRNGTQPLFIFWALHILHAPLEVPQNFLDKFSFVKDPVRQKDKAMVNFMDTVIGNVTALLKQEGLYDNTLIIFHGDNGGPLSHTNNYPLKGGKFANWEGGVRTPAFVSGGYLPASVRGTQIEGYMCGWDWYKTLTALVGVPSTDPRAAAAGLPPPDGFDMWPMISGRNKTSPRTEIPLGDFANGDRHGGATLVGGLIHGDHKIILGDQSYTGWTGPQSPNTTKKPPSANDIHHCGITPDTGCLYNIKIDPTEHHNIASQKPQLFATLLARLRVHNSTVYSPVRGTSSKEACTLAVGTYKGYWGPFVH